MQNTTRTFHGARLAAAATLAGGTAAVLVLALPHDVFAAAGSGSGSGGASSAMDAAKNFNKNGLSTISAVGIVVFAVVALWGLAKGALGGKVGQGLVMVCVAAFGAAVSVDPQGTLDTLGSWSTGLFS